MSYTNSHTPHINRQNTGNRCFKGRALSTYIVVIESLVSLSSALQLEALELLSSKPSKISQRQMTHPGPNLCRTNKFTGAQKKGARPAKHRLEPRSKSPYKQYLPPCV